MCSKMDTPWGGKLYAPEEEAPSKSLSTAPQLTLRNRLMLKGPLVGAERASC